MLVISIYNKKNVKLLFMLITILLVVGCATNLTIYNRGQSYLKKGDYESALREFKQILERKPNDPYTLTSIGISYYFLKNYSDAISYLKAGKSADPSMIDAYIYLAMSYEQQGKYREAIREYDDCIMLRPEKSVARKIEQRRVFLARELTRTEVKEALQNEVKLVSNIEKIPDNTVAVMYFTNVGAIRELDLLGKGLAGMLITDLSKAKAITLVERVKIQDLLKEINLEGVDKDTAARPGMLLGASKIITGSFNSIDGKNINIVSSITMTKTKTSRPSKGVSGLLKELFNIEKDLAFGILEDMGISLTDEEKDAIKKLPTTSFDAFMAYSKGIDLSDKGMYQESAIEFERALSIDPKFSAPKQELNEVRVLMIESKSLTSMENLHSEIRIQNEQADRLSNADSYLTSGFISLPGADNTVPISNSRGGGTKGVVPTSKVVEVEVTFP